MSNRQVCNQMSNQNRAVFAEPGGIISTESDTDAQKVSVGRF